VGSETVNKDRRRERETSWVGFCTLGGEGRWGRTSKSSSTVWLLNLTNRNPLETPKRLDPTGLIIILSSWQDDKSHPTISSDKKGIVLLLSKDN